MSEVHEPTTAARRAAVMTERFGSASANFRVYTTAEENLFHTRRTLLAQAVDKPRSRT